MPKRYRKKPVEIEAVQFNGANFDEVFSFVGTDKSYHASGMVVICTLEGNLYASRGDYIIRGAHGEFYPCKPDVFKETYELV